MLMLMGIVVTVSISGELSEKINKKINALNNDEVREYIISLIERDVNKK